MLLSLPIPVGSTTRHSGSSEDEIVSSDEAKPSFMEQQMQPSANSRMSTSDVCEISWLSRFTSPYSFSMTTTFLPVRRINSLMNVVFPAPKKPEMTSIFTFSPPHGKKQA